MDQYRVISASSPEEAQRAMNDLAGQGFRYVSLTAAGGADRLLVVMEYVGGQAGTVQSEALLAGIPSQGPTAERQLSEETLGTGRV